MGIIKTHDDFKHPEGKIQLLNGNVLDCYPLEQPKAKVDNELKLDTNGAYMSVGKPKPVATPTNDEQKKKEESLFLHNAFLFLQHRDRIMSDSRMFLCPIPIQNGLAYTGTSGFGRPTLGVYIEWWLNCEEATVFKKTRVFKKDKTKWLVYRIAGSPLSGANSCGIVNEKGETDSESLTGSFSPVWSSFMRINNRYDEAKSLYQAYTLEEVVEILEKEGLTAVIDKDLQILFLDSELRRLRKTTTDKIACLESKIESLKFQLLYDHRVELKAFVAEYKERESQVLRRAEEITEECKELRRKLKTFELNNKQYQGQITPLRKERKENTYQLHRFCDETLDGLFPDLHISLSDVERFLDDPRLSAPLQSARKSFFSHGSDEK